MCAENLNPDDKWCHRPMRRIGLWCEDHDTHYAAVSLGSLGTTDKTERECELILVITMIKESVHHFECHFPSVALIEFKHGSDFGLLSRRSLNCPMNSLFFSRMA